MSGASFAASPPFVLRWEGGLVDHPADPGGATNRGVTQKVYDAWRVGQGQPKQEVRRLADAGMQAIYESNYWRVARCDDLQRKLDVVQFDTAVNMGPGRAVRFLQAAVGCEVDGGFGLGTLQAVQGCDLGSALTAYCARREAFYDALIAKTGRLSVFRKGWMNRLDSLKGGRPARLRIGRRPARLRRHRPHPAVPDIGEEELGA